MEIVGLVVIIVAVGMYYGLFESVETASRMGNRKVERLEANQIAEDIQYYNKNAITPEDFEKAVAQKATIESYRNL